MANLYDLLMAKERGNIKDAPNKQRIGQAPLNLRSAMKYAVGGLTDADISAYVQANIGNPAAIAQAAQQYQVTAEDLARATGYSPQEVNTYFSSAGVSGPYREPESREEPVPPPPPERPRSEEPPRPRREEPPPRPRYEEPTPPQPPRYERPPEVYPVDRRKEMEAEIEKLRQMQEQEERLRELESMKRQREAEEYYFKMRNRQNPPLPPVEPRYRPEPPDMPPMPPVYEPPMPIAPAYPPNYFNPQPVVEPANVGYPLAPPPNNMPGGPVRTNPMPPSSGLLGSLGYGLGSGQSTTGQSGVGLGAGLPGQSMQGQSQGAGMGQSLDSLINYLATQRKS
jgi:hypothetical protein